MFFSDFLSAHLLYDPWLQYIANQSGSAKENVIQKIGENIKMLVCFVCIGTQDRILIDINHHYQIMMNQHKTEHKNRIKVYTR